MFLKINHLHFIGIGGSGMSGLAELLHKMGYRVSGSDCTESENTVYLRNLGLEVFIGQSLEHIHSADVVVYSTAIPADNPEMLAARTLTIPLIHRAELLAELMRPKHGIAIAGAHGKTTTTSMVATILAEAGFDPTVVIGGRLSSLGSNACLGQGDFLVAEADESDGSFLKLRPSLAIVTTLEAEHLDYYLNLENIKITFLDFLNQLPFYGAAVLCLDEEHIRDLLPHLKRRYISYGLLGQPDLSATAIQAQGLSSSFEVQWMGKLIGRLSLGVPGIHNISNALAAIAIALELDIPFSQIKEALAGFRGADRRFQITAQVNSIYLVDDYGHHPTEIKATLAAAKGVLAGDGKSEEARLIVIFQPHRYTRTRDFLNQFITCFAQADVLMITDIYTAGEQPIEGIHSSVMAEGVKQSGHRDVQYIKEMGEILSVVMEIVRPGDMVLTLGAGNIWKVNRQLADLLREKFK